MICIKTQEKTEVGLRVRVVRVKDEQAHRIVKEGNWIYCPKSDWKAYRRGEEVTL